MTARTFESPGPERAPSTVATITTILRTSCESRSFTFTFIVAQHGRAPKIQFTRQAIRMYGAATVLCSGAMARCSCTSSGARDRPADYSVASAQQ